MISYRQADYDDYLIHLEKENEYYEDYTPELLKKYKEEYDRGERDNYPLLNLPDSHVAHIAWVDNQKLAHRTDGPAVIYKDGGKTWYQRNRVHREDGPASVRPDREEAYYLDNYSMTKEEWQEKMKSGDFTRP